MRHPLGAVLCVAACLIAEVRSDAPKQKPITGGGINSQAPVDHKNNNNNNNNNKLAIYPAKLSFYSASRIYPDDLKDLGVSVPPCDKDAHIERLELPIDVCLSGDFYLRDNFKITEEPKCADGSRATLMYYQNRGCSGPAKVTSADFTEEAEEAAEEEGLAQRCLWSEKDIPTPSYYWSLVFRCNTESEVLEEQRAATPGAIVQPIQGPLAGKIRFHTGTYWLCHSEHSNRTQASDILPDACHWARGLNPLESLEILVPAVCSDGTRAQLALYEDDGKRMSSYGCTDDQRVVENGPLDIDDSMLRTCVDASRLQFKHGGFGRVRGVKFHCAGQGQAGGDETVEKTEEEPDRHSNKAEDQSRVSHSECHQSTGHWQWAESGRPATYFTPEVDSCVTLPKNHQVRIHSLPSCPNGETARFASWWFGGCDGWPRRIEGPGDYLTWNCDFWSLQQETSYMFWCQSNGIGPDDDRTGDDRAVMDTNGCPQLNMKPGWESLTEAEGPKIDRVAPDTCVRVARDKQIKIHVPAKCADGSEAKLAVWKGAHCWRDPVSKEALGGDDLDKCMTPCEDGKSCSIGFWCDGVRPT